jgi:hypothetical protein
MPNWNPNTTPTLGLEWFPHTESATSLAAASTAVIQGLPSLAAETIETVDLAVPASSASGSFLLEVFASGSEICAAATVDTFRPNQDSLAVQVDDGSGGTTNLWQEIDEAVVDTADYIRTINPTIFGHSYTYKLGTAAFPASGRRIVDVRYVFVGEQIADRSTWVVELRKQDALGPGSPGYVEFFRTSLDKSQGRQTFTASLGPINPFTGRPWTGAQIQTLDSTVAADRLSMRHRWVDETEPTSEARLYQAYLEVVWVPENRVAWGAAELPVGPVPSWQRILVRDAADVLTWAKPVGSFSYLLRRIQPPTTPGATIGNPIRAAEGSISWRWLDSGEQPPTGMESYLPTLDANGCVVDLGAVRTRAYGLVPALAGVVPSGDAQPFATYDFSTTSISGTQQQFSGAAAASYDFIRTLLYFPPGLVPAFPLDIEVFVFGGAKVGGTLTLSAADLAALPLVGDQGLRLVEGFLSAPAVLAAATQYAFEFTSIGSGPVPAVLTTNLDGLGWPGPTYGGATDAALPSALLDVDADIPFTISSSPTPPADFATSIQTQALTGSGEGCSVDDLEYVEATWTATALGADFDRYELRRSEDGGTTWQTIATIATEATTTFDDYEGLRGVAACYQVRVIRLSDGVASTWSAQSCETPQPIDCELLFVSNVDPTLNVGYIDQTPRSYDFLDAGAKVLYPVFGRDRQVAFAPLERLGDRWTINLIVSAVSTPVPEGRRVFDEILDISLAAIPYVAVLDSDGNRWLGCLQVPEGSRTEPGKLYVVPATITETTTVPTVVAIP